MNLEDLNKFSLRSGGGGGGSDDPNNKGIELQYRVMEGVNISIPVQ